MKPVFRTLMVGAAAAAAGLLAVAPAAAASPAEAAAPAAVSASASDFDCTASTSGNTVTGDCTLGTILGSFGATFTGTIQSDGNASGSITLKAGFLGNRTGTWSGGPFTSGSTATVNYSVPTPIGAFTGTFQVDIP